MQTLKDWADFYLSKKVWVYPYKGEPFKWLDWKHKKEPEYFEDFRTYDWSDAQGVSLVIGKKGIRCISLTGVENASIEYRDKLLARALYHLELPERYEWSIDYGNAICIIVETADNISGIQNQYNNVGEMLWSDGLSLPTNGCIHFYYSTLPVKRPAHIQNYLLLGFLDRLQKDMENPAEWLYSSTTKPEVNIEPKPTGCLFFLLPLFKK